MNRFKEVYRIFVTFVRGFVQALRSSKAERELRANNAKLGQALLLITEIRDNTRLNESAKALLTDNLTLLAKIRELNQWENRSSEEISVLPTGFDQKNRQYEDQINTLRHALIRQQKENETLVLGRVDELSHGLIRKVAETMQHVSPPLEHEENWKRIGYDGDSLEQEATYLDNKYRDLYNLKCKLYEISESFKNSYRA